MATETTGAVESAEQFARDLLDFGIEVAGSEIITKYEWGTRLIRKRDAAVRRAALEQAVAFVDSLEGFTSAWKIADVMRSALLAQEKADG